MRQFSFYEFVAVLTPGAALLIGVAAVYPGARLLIPSEGLSIGDFGLFVLVAYMTGHLLQGVGNGLERLWWRLWGGWPSDWPRTGRHFLLADEQIDALVRRSKTLTGLSDMKPLKKMKRGEWHAITKQIYVAAKARGRADRVDIFSGNYGLFRGLACALLVDCAMVLNQYRSVGWPVAGVLLVCTVISISRMHRFGKHYARELFVQFLQLPVGEQEGGSE